tara:strand:- start:615 stop:1010 length:396 start_codon:yes stop_codon:yes gene_type:complete
MDYTIVIVLYFLLGLFYIILSGVDLPTQIDNWLHEHHNVCYMIIGTIYIILGCVYLSGKKGKDKKGKEMFISSEEEDTETAFQKFKRQLRETFGFEFNTVNMVILFMGIFLFYCWVLLIRNESVSQPAGVM